MLIDLDRLRSPLGHEYLHIEGHEDDDCCAQVLNSGQQCTEPEAAHYAPDAVTTYLDEMAERLEDPGQDIGRDVSTYFSLSYSNHLVLPRVLLENMPTWWQLEFVTRLEQLDAAYTHIDHPEGYEVHPCRWVMVSELTEDEAKAAGVTSTLDGLRIARPPENPTQEEFDAHEKAWQDAYDNEQHYDANGNELDKHERVPIRVPNPIPHYRDRLAKVEPRLP